jgi:hypothetical protein
MSTAGPEPAADPAFPGYAVPSQAYTTPPVRHTSRRRMLMILGIAVILVAAVVSVVAWLLTPPPPLYKCPPNCGQPPTRPPSGPVSEPPAGQPAPVAGPPVSTYPRFSPGDGGFSVQYPKNISQGPITVTDTLKPNGVEVKFGDLDGQITLFGQPANGHTARDIATGLIQQYYPGAQFDYEITHAMVGYQPGYGEVDDYTPQAPTSSYTNMRVLVLVAVKNELALVATASGPYVAFEPATAQNPRGPGVTSHPSGTSLALAERMGPFVNSFTWKGDPVRSVVK